MPIDGARRTMLYFWDTALTLTYAALLGASRFYDRLFPPPPKGGWIYSPAPPICGFRGLKRKLENDPAEILPILEKEIGDKKSA